MGLTNAEVNVTNPDFIKINGENVLGELLMDLREQLREEISHQTSLLPLDNSPRVVLKSKSSSSSNLAFSHYASI